MQISFEKMVDVRCLLVIILLSNTAKGEYRGDPSGTDSPWLNKGWLRLLHYEISEKGGYKSRVENEEFFLHPRGAVDPKAEWQETLQSFASPAYVVEKSHPICRFPARKKYLLSNGYSDFVDPDCPEYESWKSSVESQKVSLMHAAQYSGNPASFFGHTFFKFHSILKKIGSREINMLDPSFGFFARMSPDTSAFDYVFKGLTGGFAGQFVGSTYHQHVFEYGSIENRSLWEYELDLTSQEVSQLLDHIWELWQNARFNYYYLDENCSFRLLTVLEAIKPEWNFSDSFHSWVLPAETVRIVHQSGAVRDINYRPSAMDELLHSYKLMNRSERTQLLTYLSKPDTSIDSESPLVVESYVKWMDQVRIQKKGVLPPKLRAKLDRTLRHRATLGRYDRPELTISNSKGVHRSHKPFMVRLSTGTHNDLGIYQEMMLRPVLHGITDPGESYTSGTEITFLTAKLRVSAEQSIPKIHSFSFVDVMSLDPYHPLQNRPAFGASFRINQAESLSCDSCSSLNFRGFLGSGPGLFEDRLRFLILPEIWAEKPFNQKDPGILATGVRAALYGELDKDLKIFSGYRVYWSDFLNSAPRLIRIVNSDIGIGIKDALSAHIKYRYLIGSRKELSAGLGYYF